MVQATYEFILLRRQRLRSLAPSFFGLHTSGDLSEGAQGARRQVSLFPIPYPLPPFSDHLILDGLAAAGDKRLNQIGRLAAYIANHAYVTWLTACRSVR